MLEADIHHQGLELPESATICRASAMLLYLQHYAMELAVYAQLARALDESGFFTSERTVMDLGSHTTQHTFSTCLFVASALSHIQVIPTTAGSLWNVA